MTDDNGTPVGPFESPRPAEVPAADESIASIVDSLAEPGEPSFAEFVPDEPAVAESPPDEPALADDAPADEPAADETLKAAAAPIVTYGRDPVERWLIGVVALVLVVFVGAAGALVAYVLSMRSAPRTAVERQLSVDEAAVKTQPQDSKNWARLALSYAKAERWSEAASAIARGRAIKKAAILDLIEADVLRMQGDKGAVAAYDRAIKSSQAEYDRAQQVLRAEKGVSVPMSNPMVAAAQRGKALALEEAGRAEEGIEAAKLSLALNPTDADLNVALGRMYAKLGRSADAEAAFRKALSFVPGYEPAVKGLKSIGKEQ